MSVLTLRSSVPVEHGEGVSAVVVISGSGSTGPGAVAAGAVVGAGTTSGQVKLVDCSSLTVLHTLPRHGSCVTDMRCNPTDGNLLVTASRDGSVAVYDIRCAASQVARFRQSLEFEDVDCLSADIVGPLLVCGINNAVRVYDLRAAAAAEAPDHVKRSAALVAEFPQSHTDVVNCVRFHPSTPALIFSSADDDLIALHDLRRVGRTTASPPWGYSRGTPNSSQSTATRAESGTESADEETLASLDEDDAFVGAFSNESPARILHFFSDNELATASTVESLRLWNVECGDDGFESAAPLGPASTAIRGFEPFADPVEALPAGVVVGFTSIGGRKLAIGASNWAPNMAAWEVGPQNGGLEPFGTFAASGQQHHSGVVRCCAGLGAHNAIITAGEDGRICIWA